MSSQTQQCDPAAIELPGLDLDQFRRYFAQQRPGERGPLDARLIAGGRSNLTYEVADGHSWWIFRRPPLGHILATAHDMSREFSVMTAAWLMDVKGNKAAHGEIQAIKIATPRAAEWILDKAIQVHGAGGLSQDFPLAEYFASVRTLRILDGPDEVHKNALARGELKRRAEVRRDN